MLGKEIKVNAFGRCFGKLRPVIVKLYDLHLCVLQNSIFESPDPSLSGYSSAYYLFNSYDNSTL